MTEDNAAPTTISPTLLSALKSEPLENLVAGRPPFVTPSPMGATDKPVKEIPDPDRFLMTAKRVAVANYNASRDAGRSPEITTDQTYIVWFTKTLGNWKAIVASPAARGLLWEITFNGHKNECYVDVYKKLNNVKVSLEDIS